MTKNARCKKQLILGQHNKMLSGLPRGFRGPEAKLENEALLSVIKASRSRKEGKLGEPNLEALLEPCRLLLLGGSLKTS